MKIEELKVIDQNIVSALESFPFAEEVSREPLDIQIDILIMFARRLKLYSATSFLRKAIKNED